MVGKRLVTVRKVRIKERKRPHGPKRLRNSKEGFEVNEWTMEDGVPGHKVAESSQVNTTPESKDKRGSERGLICEGNQKGVGWTLRGRNMAPLHSKTRSRQQQQPEALRRGGESCIERNQANKEKSH